MPQLQLTAANVTGADTPLTVTVRGSEVATLPAAAIVSARGQDLAAVGEGGDPGRHVDAHPAVVGAAAVRLGGVEADPDRAGEADLGAQVAQRLLDADRTVDRRAGPVEGDEEPVAGRVDDLPSRGGDLRSRSMSSCLRRTASQAWSPRASARVVEPTMSVNMNVFVAVAGPLRRSARSRSSRSAASMSTRAPSWANDGKRRFELEIGAVAVVDAPQRARQDRAGSGHFVRRTDLAPALDRDAQLPDRAWRIALGQEDASQGDLAAGLEGR